MILDTSYFLPLAKIEVGTDLLLAVAEGRIDPDRLSLDLVTLNSISLFELQAKAAKLKVNTSSVTEAIGAITTLFRIEPYSTGEIIEIASTLRHDFFTDYVDCIITATAVKLGEELATEDSKILRKRKELLDEYNLKISSYRDLTLQVVP